MKAQHTPGPWAYKPTSGRDYGSTIYWVPDVCHNINTEADARLIAAAPELLDALKVAEQFLSIASDWNLDEAEINGEMRSTYDWIEVIRAAISKATEGAK